MVFREFIKHTFQFLVEAVLHIISFIFCWSMNVQNNDMTPDDILSLINSTLLTADMILYLIHDCHSIFNRKTCILLLVQCYHTPIWPPACPDMITSEPALYKLTFHVPNHISIFCHLCHLSKESIHVWGSPNCSITCLFLTVKGC
jgi:hypothetical protein